jgi:hypothetical protein
MEKGSWENRKGKEILEAGIDLNKSKIFMTRRFHPLGYKVKGKNIQIE